MTDRKPIHTRTKTGRHKVDLKQLPAAARYVISLGVVALVLGLAVRFGSDHGVTEEKVAPFVPIVGGAVILIVLLGIFLQLKGKR
ncbi:hypothetical protein [Parerythrobacter aestuarii]|uniref:hypothetical protein n=1 Tax=Parerythrobacter aestuarii TaxID=3020909 RepID=UPI0024DECE6F|nr:hypothetical protein [Parerythrobacter aestuarii]